MGTRLNLFHASTRVASTGNLRGMPSLGSASSVATRKVPVAADLRRKGSRKTAKPAPTGKSARSAPMPPAKIFLRKSRRPVDGAPVLGPLILHLDATALENVPTTGKTQERLRSSKSTASSRRPCRAGTIAQKKMPARRSNGSEAVKKLKSTEVRLSKSLIIKRDFSRFSQFLNFFTASQ